MEHNTNIRFSELICDYIRDTAGIWWFIGVKAFKIEETTAKPILRGFMNVFEYVDHDDKSHKKGGGGGLNRNRRALAENEVGSGSGMGSNGAGQEKNSEYVKVRICRFC